MCFKPAVPTDLCILAREYDGACMIAADSSIGSCMLVSPWKAVWKKLKRSIHSMSQPGKKGEESGATERTIYISNWENVTKPCLQPLPVTSFMCNRKVVHSFCKEQILVIFLYFLPNFMLLQADLYLMIPLFLQLLWSSSSINVMLDAFDLY